MNLVYRYRVKNCAGRLNEAARAVNFVWNYCNDRQRDALRWSKRWLTGFDLCSLTAGTSTDLRLSATTINAICTRYAQSRRGSNRPYLRYRGIKSLGWIPLRAVDVKRKGDSFRCFGETLRVFDSRPFPLGARIRDGSNLSQDARGNWYLNVCLEVEIDPESRSVRLAVGVDLGLKDFAALSTGETIPNPRHFQTTERKLAVAQRARKKRQASKIHAKIGNARRDHLHKLSTRIVREFDHIAVGNVNAKALARTGMAKSVNDASWSTFRRMLAYKSIRNGARYIEVDEAFTTQTCSDCGSIGGPKGREGLVIREWVCADCGTVHDRDVNAARNLLLRSGHGSLVEGVAA